MKQKDIGLIAVIAIVSAVISLILSNTFLTTPDNRSEKVEVVTPLESDFVRPPSEYFNDDAINPTKQISIGNEDNDSPFGDD